MEARAEAGRSRTSRARVGAAVSGVLSLTTLATLTACSAPAASGTAGNRPGLSGRSQPLSPAPPGKYQVLPEPCWTVNGDTLRALLPNSPDYGGDERLSYDTDRRSGCVWQGSAPGGGSRELSIDLERVVSYDPAVSDEDEAAQDFAQLARAAHVAIVGPNVSTAPSGSPAGSPSGSPSAPASSSASPSPSASASASRSPSASADSKGPSAAPAADTSPRQVGGIGDEAFLTDNVVRDVAQVRRDVTVVFRMANVLVTVEFSQWIAGKAADPPGTDLQLGAHGIAQGIAREFD